MSLALALHVAGLVPPHYRVEAAALSGHMIGSERATHFSLLPRGAVPSSKPFLKRQAGNSATLKIDGLVCLSPLPQVKS